jgi:small-conductance mechanosensitive channel
MFSRCWQVGSPAGGELLYILVVTVAATAVAGLAYWAARRLAYRLLSGVVDRRLLGLLEPVFAVLAASLFLAVTANVYGFPLLALVALSALIIGSLALLVGFRHVIEEYFTGLVLVKAFGLKVGDYVEFEDARGYVVALGDTALVVRNPHRDLVYIPYTRLARSHFKRLKAGEGHEIKVHVHAPHGPGLARVREEASRIAGSLGVENARVDVESIGEDGVLLAVRGVIRDPRREEEIRYAILDHVYSAINPTSQTREDGG